MEKQRVFISHSMTDVDWARAFAQALKQRGISVWFDEFEVQPGKSSLDALEAGLRDSDVLVALMDPESTSRPNLFFELGQLLAWENELYPLCPKARKQVLCL